MATYYCNIDSGSDSNSGTSASPFKTLSKGLNTATASGDILILAPSSTASYTMVTKTLPANFTIRCETKPNMITSSYARINDGGGANYWQLTGDFTLENIVMYNMSPTGSTIYHGNFATPRQTIQFTNCVIDTISTTVSTAARGGFVGNGSSVSTPAQTVIEINFDRCLFYNIKSRNSVPNSSAFVSLFASNYEVNFRESTFYNPSTGYPLDTILAYYSSAITPYFRNCIMFFEDTKLPKLNATYSGVTTGNSTVQNCVYQGINTGGVTFNSSINADPQFLDKTNRDFRLQSDSPAINAGLLV